jgi:hypothetical protein
VLIHDSWVRSTITFGGYAAGSSARIRHVT